MKENPLIRLAVSHVNAIRIAPTGHTTVNEKYALLLYLTFVGQIRYPALIMLIFEIPCYECTATSADFSHSRTVYHYLYPCSFPDLYSSQ